MKKGVIILIFQLFSFVSFSQTLPEFAPIGAVWYYHHIHVSDAGFDFTKAVSLDSLTVAGKKGKNISGDTLSADSLHLYQFKSIIHRWTLLADFSKQAGDSFYVDASYYGTPDSFIVHILVKGDTIIHGFTLPYIITDIDHNSAASQDIIYGDKIIQNIGSLNYLIPFPGQDDPPPGSGLRCYTDKNIGTYQPPYFASWPCDSVFSGIHIGVQNINDANNRIWCYQKEETVHLKFKSGEWNNLSVYDELGRNVEQEKINENQNDIPLSFLLPEHIYFVALRNNNFSQRLTVLKQ